MLESQLHWFTSNFPIKPRFFVLGICLIIILGASIIFLKKSSKEPLDELPTTIAKHEDTPSPENITVEVAGAVKKPGVYIVPVGARISEVLGLALGLTNTADISFVSKNISLASKATDASKIYIPFLWDTSIVGSSTQTNYQDEITIFKDNGNETGTQGALNPNKSVKSASDNLTSNNINSCTKDVLLALNGVGDVYASKIIENRPYKDIKELTNKVKLPTKVVQEIEENLVF